MPTIAPLLTRLMLAPLRSLLATTLLGLLLAFSFQGSRGLWETDEGRYTQVGLQMLRMDDWLTPHRHHHRIHPTKPPMTYWAIAGSVRAFGYSEWAVRLPNALAFLGTLLLVFLIGRRWLPLLPGLPVLIYGTMAVPFFANNWVSTDTLLCFFETLAMVGFVAWRWPGGSNLDHRRRGRSAWLLLMWVAFGLACLTKGPPGLLPLAALLAFSLHDGGWPAFRRLLPWGGLLAFAVVGLSWYLLVTIKNPGLFAYLVKDEVINRVASDDFGHFPQWWGGLYVYGSVLLLGTLPWIVPGILARPHRDGPSFASEPIDPAQTRLLRWWLLLPLAVFLLSRSRLPLYILPLLVPVALMLARRLYPRRRLLHLCLLLLPLWIAALIGVKGLIAEMPHVRSIGEWLRVMRGEQVWVPQNKDMRAFARALPKLVPFQPIELVFVEESPRYGLGFYLDVETEWIGLDESDPRFDDHLQHELQEIEPGQVAGGRRLYLLKAPRRQAFEDKLAGFGYRAIHYGHLHRLELFGVEPLASAPLKVPAPTPDQ
ncbi:MAG: ArnT family glycosyltransferase [Lysobacterales bacterium]